MEAEETKQIILPPNVNKIIAESFAIEAEEAKQAGTLGYMARALVQATIPHKRVLTNEFVRKNGAFTLSILSPSNVGLPYGTKPRLVLAFISTEAVRTKSKEIVLGNSLSDFMRQLDLTPTGGRWGSIPMLKEQVNRLFSATVCFQYNGTPAINVSGGFRIANRAILFWDTKDPYQTSFWESTVTLTQEFYDEIVNNPVPIDMRVLEALKDSSMAIDIYCWLTYRMSYLRRPTEIPWGSLAAQFGSGYLNTYSFKWNFLKQLKKVLVIYNPNVSEGKNGLMLKPSKTHIPIAVHC